MQKNLIYTLLIFLFSCGRLPESKGEFNEIIIITSEEDKDIIYYDVNEIFGEVINTPSEEPIYSVKWVEPNKFKYYLGYKNILFLSLDNPPDSTIDRLVGKFKINYEQNLFSLSDVYAKNQNLFIVSLSDSIKFKNDVLSSSDWIINNVNEKINLSLENYIYRNGTNEELELLVNNHFNINSSIQKDFLVIKDKLEINDFLWIGRGYPYRWICFDKITNVTEVELWDAFNLSVSENMENVIITDYYKNISYISDDIIKIQGLYEEKQSDTGGPFIAFAKFNEMDNTMLLISGFVNNPGKPKIRLLKELEIQILKSIK
tara:strand:- start:1452 stop:2402 length:951 start_codon:yes stop_codon:yes gene_type:complete